MTADTLKSGSITNADATPIVANTQGEGAPCYLDNLTDWVSATAAGLADTTSTYKMVRLGSTVKLKTMKITATVDLDSNVSPALAVDVGAYYSDSTTDGTQSSLQGTLISATCFAAAVAFAQHTAVAREIDALAGFSVDKRNMPLWLALGLASDPGGFIDVVLAVHTAAATGVAGKIGCRADFAQGA